MLCTSWDVVQVATCTEDLYKLQLVQAVCTSCNLYKISCTSYNLYRILPSNNLNLYKPVVQVGITEKLQKLLKYVVF